MSDLCYFVRGELGSKGFQNNNISRGLDIKEQVSNILVISIIFIGAFMVN